MMRLDNYGYDTDPDPFVVNYRTTVYVDSGISDCVTYNPSNQTCSGGTYKAYNEIQETFTNEDFGDGEDHIIEIRATTPGGSTTYTEAVTIGLLDGGTSGHPVTVKGRSGDTITIDGTSVPGTGLVVQSNYIDFQNLTLSGNPYGLYISSTSSSAVGNLNFTNVDCTYATSSGAVVTQNANARLYEISYITFTGCIFNYNGNTGALVQGTSADAPVHHVTFTNCNARYNNLDGGQDRQGFGIGGSSEEFNDTSWTCDGGNDCYRTLDYDNPYRIFQSTPTKRELTLGTLPLSDGEYYMSSTTLYVDVGENLSLSARQFHIQWGVSRNIIWDSCIASHNGDRDSDNTDGNGFYFAHAEDSEMRYCYSHDNDGGGVMAGYADNIIIRDSILVDNGVETDNGQGAGVNIRKHSNDIYIYNNTIYNNTRGGVQMQDDSGTEGGNIYVVNNILSNHSDSTYGYGINDIGSGYTVSEDHNLFYLNNQGDIYGGSIDATSQNANPLFTNPTSGTFDGFTLQGSSPAKNAGVDLGDNYDELLDQRDTTWPPSLVDPDLSGWNIGAFGNKVYYAHPNGEATFANAVGNCDTTANCMDEATFEASTFTAGDEVVFCIADGATAWAEDGWLTLGNGFGGQGTSENPMILTFESPGVTFTSGGLKITRVQYVESSADTGWFYADGVTGTGLWLNPTAAWEHLLLRRISSINNTVRGFYLSENAGNCDFTVNDIEITNYIFNNNNHYGVGVSKRCGTLSNVVFDYGQVNGNNADGSGDQNGMGIGALYISAQFRMDLPK